MFTDNVEEDYKDLQSTNENEAEHTDNRSISVWTPWKCVILRLSESPILVPTSDASCVALDPHGNAAKNRTSLFPKGVIEEIPNKPIYILIGNFSLGRSTFQKNGCHNHFSASEKSFANPVRQHTATSWRR